MPLANLQERVTPANINSAKAAEEDFEQSSSVHCGSTTLGMLPDIPIHNYYPTPTRSAPAYLLNRHLGANGGRRDDKLNRIQMLGFFPKLHLQATTQFYWVPAI